MILPSPLLTVSEQTALSALVNRIVPPDDLTLGGADAGAAEYLLHQLSPTGDLSPFLDRYRAFLADLGGDFAALPPGAQDARLQALSQNDTWQTFFRQMVEQVQEGFYTSETGKKMIGWVESDAGQAVAATKPSVPVPPSSLRTADYDVVIVGAGAGGGVIAGILAEAGKRVLLLERGNSLTFEQVGRDHLRNQRLSQYGTNAGPDNGQPRVFTDSGGRTSTILPHDGSYQNNAATVGGGTRVYGAQAWRFHPLDFRMGLDLWCAGRVIARRLAHKLRGIGPVLRAGRAGVGCCWRRGTDGTPTTL